MLFYLILQLFKQKKNLVKKVVINFVRYHNLNYLVSNNNSNKCPIQIISTTLNFVLKLYDYISKVKLKICIWLPFSEREILFTF